MSDVLVFPNARAAVADLIDGGEHVGVKVEAHYSMPINSYGSPSGNFPLAVIKTEPGTQGHIDRTDRIVVTVYGYGSDPTMDIAQSIHALLVGKDIETPSGFIDEIQPDQTPNELEYYSEELNQVEFRVMVTTRPV